MTDEPLVSVAGLEVELEDGTSIVDEIDLAVHRGEIVGLVGESGSGKTTLALALLGFAKRGVRIARGRVCVGGRELTELNDKELRHLRGRVVSYVPQEPSTWLDPSYRIGAQVAEVVQSHTSRAGGGDLVERAFDRVGLPVRRDFLRRFPHQVSGGQLQRVAIALAIACEPQLVVLDEPTTGLDVVTQARFLREMHRLRDEAGATLVYVTHDLAVVSQLADRIAVMYAGRIVEEGLARDVLAAPKHPYTRGLVSSVPDHVAPRRLRGLPGVAVGPDERPRGCAFAPRCPQRVTRCEVSMPPLECVTSAPAQGPGHRVRCYEWRRTPAVDRSPSLAGRGRSAAAAALLEVQRLRTIYRGRRESVVAARDVSFAVEPGECVALVGESGSGKTTVARCIVGLQEPDDGAVLLDGRRLAPKAGGRSREDRRRIQIIFQNPADSLNPRHRVREAVARPAQVLRGLASEKAYAEVAHLLDQVRLSAAVATRFPSQLSGGERQRVALARALAATPDLLVCDEITSALDVSVQAAVLDLLSSLRNELGLAMLFISHDLAVTSSVADRVIVLQRGEIKEQGAVANVLQRPADDYTRSLLAAAPRLVWADGELGRPPSLEAS
jgi:peptide/nickel transport system ATP-binding protein